MDMKKKLILMDVELSQKIVQALGDHVVLSPSEEISLAKVVRRVISNWRTNKANA